MVRSLHPLSLVLPPLGASGAAALADPPQPSQPPTPVTDVDRSFWSFQQPKASEPPEPKTNTGWPRNRVDRWVLRKLEAKKITPAPEASRATLIRRLAFDLTGLPAAPAEVDAFLLDNRPDAYEKLV